MDLTASQAIRCRVCGAEMAVVDMSATFTVNQRLQEMPPMQWERAGRPDPEREKITLVLQCTQHHRVPSIFDEYSTQRAGNDEPR